MTMTSAIEADPGDMTATPLRHPTLIGPGFGSDAAGDPVTPTPAQSLALLARAMFRQGMCDGLAGHATFRQPNGVLLTTPHLIGWDEVTAADICTLDPDGHQIAGRWSVPPALQLHISLHRSRPDTVVAVHNHPKWSTTWSNLGRIPPTYDQTSASFTDEVRLIPYGGPVQETEFADDVVAELAGASTALLANHGVLILGSSPAEAFWRCYVLQWRCQMAWQVEAVGSGTLFPSDAAEFNKAIVDREFGGVFPGLFEYVARREIAADPRVLS
jgi:ribulose-5-phosphate 4-epimerase/fuculose-1-phosphate aldolase